MSTKDILIALINDANHTVVPLTESDVTLSAPAANSATSKNTKIVVSSVDHSGYTGSVEVHYDRINLQLTEPAGGYRSENDITVDDILAMLNVDSPVPLTVDDVDIAIPPLIIGEIRTITISAKSDSLGWNGDAQVSMLKGLTPNSDDLYNLMNHLLPSS